MVEIVQAGNPEFFDRTATLMNIPDPGEKKRLVVVGGGFGGLKLTRTFKDPRFQVVLLDKRNHHIFQPLLYQVAVGGIEPSTVSFPFRSIFVNRENFHFRVCEVLSVDPEHNIIKTSIGTLKYDYLVIATGGDTNYFGNKWLEVSTMALKNTAEALYNRNQIFESFELALATDNPLERARFLTFVIVGGGATGVELAGALAEFKKFVLAKDYPDLDPNEVRIIIADGAPRLLNVFNERYSKEAADYLESRGVELKLGTRVLSFERGVLKFTDEEIETYNVFWAAGIKSNGMPGFPEETYAPGNRIKVNQYCQVEGYKNIFATGDCCCHPTEKYPKGLPQVAQPALQGAVNIAHNILNMEDGMSLEPLKYFDKGSMATIGRNHAVVEIGKFNFGGFFGWFLWLALHLVYLVGV
ncbi:MAG: NAD(P)/FAD-dependent oxidoreductase, partial [Burkholderiales bacterium]|nr:NAD(P)/FAD-dependent oxidoreductase [Burkholderiales bacterium]